MPGRYLLIPIRSSRQGVQVNVGKEGPDYQTLVTVLTMHPEDMREAGVQAGQQVRVRTQHGRRSLFVNRGTFPVVYFLCLTDLLLAD
jgi:formylmethanofuran dehydrogenase subunit D